MEITPIASGYCFLEAPRADGECVWFSDLLLGGIYRHSPGGKIDQYVPERLQIGGIVLNEDGRLVLGGEGNLAWLDPVSGETGVILDRLQGEEIHGVNDMYPDGRGGLYFGTLARPTVDGPSPTALFHMSADGTVRLQQDELSPSNGIGISPDGRYLYHVESLLAVMMYDIQDDGELTNGRVFNDMTDGDGLAVDAEGGVWVARFSSSEVIRLNADGEMSDRLPLPHKQVTSVCFGGLDWRDIYIVTAGNRGIDALMTGSIPPREAAIFQGRVHIPGMAVPKTNFRLTTERTA